MSVCFDIHAIRVQPPPLLVNVPVLTGIALAILAGEVLLLSRFPRLFPFELAWLALSMTIFAALVTVLAAAVGGLAARSRAGFRAAVVWMLLLSASLVYLSNYFGYVWVGLHLHETIPLLIENIPSFQSTMRSKMTALILALGVCAAAFCSGVAVLGYASARSKWLAWPVPAVRLLAWVVMLVLLLLAERVVSPYALGLAAYDAKNRILWQPDVYAPRHPSAPNNIFEIDALTFRQVVPDATMDTALAGLGPADVRQPKNVFFFIIDSLRDDSITPETAPNLYALKQRSVPALAGVAASNVTHISWFSLLHGVNPLYWSVTAHQEHSKGALPLRVLQKIGYRINALSCSSLEYFGFERSIFGDGPSLASSVIDARTVFDPATDRGEGDVDQKLMARLNADVGTLRPESRSFYLVILDSTHHDYSWSRRYQPKFVPYTEHVSVFSTPRDQIEPLRNRYKNAVNYVDMLFGEFVAALEARGLLEHSIIVVTGDHGEEFFERGNLVHSSQLNRFQTRVPILIAVPGASPVPAARVAAHADIFPTIFMALGLAPKTHQLFEGSSLLEDDPARAAYSVMASSYSPTEAILDAGDYKLFLELEGARKVGRTLYARRLVASKVLTADDQPVVPGQQGHPSAREFKERFRPALRKLIAGDLGF